MFSVKSSEKIREKILLSFFIFILGVFPGRLRAEEGLRIQTAASEADEKADTEQLFKKYLDRGLSLHLDAHDFEKAANYFEMAVSIHPKDTAARKALKVAREKIAKKVTSREEIEAGELEKAGQYYDSKQYLIAVITLKSVLEKNPNQEAAKKIARKIRRNLESLSKKESVDSYQWAIEKGMTAYIDGRYEDAVNFWRKATAISPKNQLMDMALEQAESRFGASRSSSSLVNEPCDCEIPQHDGPPLLNLSLNPKFPLPVATTARLEKPSSTNPVPPVLEPVPVQEPGLVPMEEFEKFPEPQRPRTSEGSKESPVQRAQAVPNPQVQAAPEIQKAQKAEEFRKLEEHGELPEKAKAVQLALKNLRQETPALLESPRRSHDLATPPVQFPAPSAGPSELTGAALLLLNKDYLRSIESLKKFLQENPGNTEANELLNRAFLEQKAFASAHYRQGLLAYAEGQYSRAFEEWQKVLKIDPEYPNIKKVLLKAFFGQK